MNLCINPCLLSVKAVGCNASAHQELQAYRGTNTSQLEVVNYAQRFQECQATHTEAEAICKSSARLVGAHRQQR